MADAALQYHMGSAAVLTTVRAVSIFTARSQACFPLVMACVRVAPFKVQLGRRKCPVGDFRNMSLLLVDVVVLASSDCDLQHALWWSAAECEMAGRRVELSLSLRPCFSAEKWFPLGWE